MKKRILFSLLGFLAIGSYASDFNKVVYPQTTNIETLYIETFDGQEVTTKDYYKYCRLVLVSDTGEFRMDSVQIRGRGNASWGFAKKPYRIKFPKKQKFLGKGYARAKNWTLLSNGGEKLMFRNGLASYVGEFLDQEFNPACRFVDLYMNDHYRGTYQISDQVEVHNKRVEVLEQDTLVTDPNTNITGGYLIEMDGNGTENVNKYFYSTTGVRVAIHSPDWEVRNNDQLNYIKDHFNKFEAAVLSSKYDGENGFGQYVDSTTFLGWYLTNEIASNCDMFYSIYMYKHVDDDKFHFGPVWDIDLGFNDDSRRGDMTEKLVNEYGFDATYYQAWMRGISKSDWFQKAATEFYHDRYKDGKLDEYMLHYIDSVHQLIRPSVDLNYQVWSINAQTHLEIDLFDTYDEYIEAIKEFVVKHNAYIERALYKGTDHYFTANENAYYRICNKQYPQFVLGVTDSTAEKPTVAIRALDESQYAQLWEFRPVGEKTYLIVNVRTGKALRDERDRNNKTTITTVTPDVNDGNQLWKPVSLYPGYFNIKNATTNLVLVNSNGRSRDLNAVNGYTSGNLDATNDSRMWDFVEVPKGSGTDGIMAEKQVEYRLRYNTGSHVLRFLAQDLSQLVFKAEIYNLNGQKVGSFRGDETFDASPLPAGTYIVSWQFAGRSHSTKFLKN